MARYTEANAPPPPPPRQPQNNKTNTPTTNLGTSPSLSTSTGGLFGTNGLLLTPVVNLNTGSSYLLLMDANNFNCDEDARYDFPEEIPPRDMPQEGRDVTLHLMILKYRELGVVTFTINIRVYQKTTDSFVNYPYTVNVPSISLSKTRLATFPDKKIHTIRIPCNVVGERPQASILYKANKGPVAVTSLVLCGNADEEVQH